MAAASSTALNAPRRLWWGRSRHKAFSAVLVTLALAAVTSMVGRELVTIQSLATDVQGVVLPQIMTRHQRAIWIESLRSAADVVLYAPDRMTRHRALAKAEQLAANVSYADLASRQALHDAWASIRLAAGKTDEAQRIAHQMQAMLTEADDLIGDMSANLSSIVDDSGATIARIIKEAMGPAQSPYPRQILDEVLAINSTSHELLSSLDRGRIILGSALSLEDDRKLTAAQAHFGAIGAQLKARVDTLRGNSDYEYLPEMIERFARLNALFDHQRLKLDLLQAAMVASASAKLRLGVVRETLAADAAAAAEAGVGDIADSASRIKLAAVAMMMMLILAAAVALSRNRRGGAAGRAPPMAGADAAALHALPDGALGAAVAALESLIKAQGNLAHWRRTLIEKLTGAVGSVLQRAAGHAVDVALPPELVPCLNRLVALIEDVAARTSLAGLSAALHGVRLMGAVGADPASPEEPAAGTDRPFPPADALAAAAAAAAAVSERVGTTVCEVNALSPRADGDPDRAGAEIVQMLVRLADEVAAIRDGDWQRSRQAG